MGLMSRLGRIVGGRANAQIIEGYREELRALHVKVGRLDEELLQLRKQTRETVDDLGDRIGTMSERLNSTS